MEPILRPGRHGLVAMVRASSGDDGEHELARALAALHPREQQLALTLAPLRKAEWILGRTALRQALRGQDLADDLPLLRDDRGAPSVPATAAASLSHKGRWAAALAAPRQATRSIGVDLEHAAPSRYDISARVLTDRELRQLESLNERARGLAVTLRFSAKEAVYKAIDPWLRRYVGFREVEVELDDQGEGRAHAVDPRLASELAGCTLELTWAQVEDHWLCTALVERR